jgi:DNA invertase Pin-like site-specific DNA recombinase
MKLDFCAVCGVTTDLQQHHIEPVVLSNISRKKIKKYDANKQLKDCNSMEVFSFLFDQGIITDDGEITVCSYHHNILHGIVKFQKANLANLIKEGQQRAKARGVKIGRPTIITPENFERIRNMRESGIGIKKIARELKIGIGTVYSSLEKIDAGIIEDLYKKKLLQENPATFVDLI